MDDANKEAVEGYTFTLRQLRLLRAEHQPDSVDDLFHLLEMWIDYNLRQARLQRDKEAKRELNGDD
jgi:hypothetical protein